MALLHHEDASSFPRYCKYVRVCVVHFNCRTGKARVRSVIFSSFGCIRLNDHVIVTQFPWKMFR